MPSPRLTPEPHGAAAFALDPSRLRRGATGQPAWISEHERAQDLRSTDITEWKRGDPAPVGGATVTFSSAEDWSWQQQCAEYLAASGAQAGVFYLVTRHINEQGTPTNDATLYTGTILTPAGIKTALRNINGGARPTLGFSCEVRLNEVRVWGSKDRYVSAARG